MNKNEQMRKVVSLDAILNELSEEKVQLVTVEAGDLLDDAKAAWEWAKQKEAEAAQWVKDQWDKVNVTVDIKVTAEYHSNGQPATKSNTPDAGCNTYPSSD